MKSLLLALAFSCVGVASHAQTLEWRLVNSSFDNTDPDGAGPAIGSASFTLQIHSTGANAANINTISTGYSYNSADVMVPTGVSGPGCSAQANNPANVTVAPTFGDGWAYTAVNQCGNVTQTTGGQTFNRRAVGTLEGTNTTITSAWADVMTIRMWRLTNNAFVIINSSEGGTPGQFTTYAVSNDIGTSIPTNSLTYNIPLSLGAPLPVGLSNFGITCTGNGALLNWKTLNEQNSRSFEIEKSSNGATNWTLVGSTNAAGNSTAARQYEYYDLKGGTAYYRLRQVDKDGRFTYSSVQRVNCESQLSSILLYPNPAKNNLNVVLAAERDAKATIVLYDISGKAMHQISTQLMKGNNNIKLNIAGLSSGEYILKVIGTEVFKTQKVTVIN